MICNAANTQAFPAVAYGGNVYLAAWSDSRLNVSQYNIYAARVNPSGTVLDPGGIQVGTSAATTQLCPSVVFGGARFLVVWGNYNVPGNVYGRFIYPDGTMNDTFRIASANYVYGTDMAYSGTNFMVIWAEETGGGYSLKGQLVSTTGSPIGSTIPIATNVEYYLSVHLCYDGTNYFVVYADADQFGDHQIYGRRFNTAGAPVGGVIPISNSGYLCYYPNVAAGSNNRYLNVWDEEHPSFMGIYGNVDIMVINVEEEDKVSRNAARFPTIISRRQALPAGGSYRFYDISGREVQQNRLVPGVYFVVHEDEVMKKIVLIK